MDLLHGCTSSPNAHFEPTPERRPMPEDMCSDVSAATQLASSPGGSTSPTVTVCKRDGLDMIDMDHEACEPSSHRNPVGVGQPDVMDYLQDSPEILAPWVQLTPDDAFEQCFQWDDLDSLKENGACLVDFQIQSQFDCNSDSGNSENSDTISPSVSMEIRDDQTIVTTSSDSMGTSTPTHRSSGKRTCRPEKAKIVEARGIKLEGVEPETQPKHSMNSGGQGRHLRKRLSSSDESTRYTIKTTTDVDMIDDGYRWRKYGQKPVKNSVHPRSYYRCTTPNCPVRKQVERCTENPHNVLTTYDGKHIHPNSPSLSTRESISAGNAEDLLSSAPIRPHDGPPARLPPSNYLSQTLLDHMFSGALLDGPGWPNAPPQGFSQGNFNLLRAQQLFMLQCQRQYPFFSGMLSLMQNYPLAQSPVLDPRLALLAAQNYGMRLRAQAHSDRSAAAIAAAQQASRSAAPLSTMSTMSRSQLRLLRMQELMGENRYSLGDDVHRSQQQS